MENDSLSKKQVLLIRKIKTLAKNWVADIKIKWFYIDVYIFFSKMCNI